MILFYRFLCINFWDSEQINCVNLWLSDSLSELLTSLKATLRVSDLSFRFTIRTFNFIESHTSCVRFIFRFNKKRKTSPPNPFFFRNTKGVETVLFEHISTKCVTQHINKSTEEGVFIYKTFSVN